MNSNNKRLIAPRIKGGRIHRSTGLHPKVEARIEKLRIKFNCSRAFVIASMLAEFLEIHDEGKYYE